MKMRNVLITGTNRGLGLGLTRKFLSNNFTVLATCRNLNSSPELQKLRKIFGAKLRVCEVDLNDEDASQQISDFTGDRCLDYFVGNAGIIGPNDQSFGSINEKNWFNTLKINLISPFLISQKLLANIKDSKEKKIFFMSSKVGSIADNRAGGMYIYRSSKTALNQIIKSMSIDLYHYNISVIALHPGWVKTQMGGPNALISVEESVNNMFETMKNSSINSTGKFLNYDGNEIPW